MKWLIKGIKSIKITIKLQIIMKAEATDARILQNKINKLQDLN